MRYKFIINGNAGNGKTKKNIQSILDHIKKHFVNYDFCITEKLSDLNNCLNSTENINAVIAVGGDGTINGIINKIINRDILFGIVPSGSGNDFIHALNIPNNMNAAFEIIKKNNTKRIDVGQIITDKYQKYFINAVGIGFDAMVAYKTNRIEFIKGSTKYYLALMHSLFAYKSHELQIKIDGKTSTKRAYLFTIGNGQRTGGAFLLTPGALLDDAMFDLCLVDDVSIPFVIKALPKVLKGSHGSMKQVKFLKAKSVTVSSDCELYVHYDGETPCKVRSAEINIIPGKINVIC